MAIVGINRLGSGLLAAALAPPPAGACIIDGGVRHQAWDGCGVTNYNPIAYTSGWSANADALWSQSSGIGISLYNCAIAVDGSGNVGPLYQNNAFSANIVGDWSHEQAAWARGCRIFCVRVWTYQFAAPFTWQAGSTQNGALNVGDYTNAANAITTFLTNAVTAGVYFSYVSPWNEPDISPSYPQIAWSTAQILAFIKVLGPVLATWAATSTGLAWQAVTGLAVPQILGCESFDFANAVGTYIPAFEGDATALSYVGVYSNHQYNGGGVSAPPTPCSRKIWMTECSTQGGAWDATMTDAMNVMGYVYNALTTGNVSAWWFWWAEADNQETDNEGLLGFVTENVPSWNAPDYTKRFYCFGNFAKFVRPGSTRIDASNAPAGVNILAFLVPNTITGSRVAIVCINTNGSPTAITCYLKGVGASQVTPWITDATHNLAAQTPIPTTGGGSTFTATLNATSVTTFVY